MSESKIKKLESVALKKRKKDDAKEIKAKKKNVDGTEKGNDSVKEKKKDKKAGKDKDKQMRNINPKEEVESKETPVGPAGSEQYEALVIVPPDGGWGWVIVLACFLILMCSDGSMNSYGTFSFNIEKEFHVRVAETSIISSVATCLYYLCGPVWGALGNRYGFRKILMAGAGLMAAGNLCAFFITNAFIPFAMVYAIAIGTGGGMIFMSASVMVGIYFERWRGYAISLVSCGSSLGTVFLPPVYAYVSEHGWRYVLAVNTCLLGCSVFLGILVRPLQPTLITARPEPKQVQFKAKPKKVKKVKQKAGVQAQHPTAQEVLQTSSFVTLKGFGGAGGSTTSVYMSTVEERVPSTPPTEEQIEGAGARPMYRDDIFYGASAARLGSQSTYQMSGFSTIRLPAVDEEKHKRCPCWSYTKCCPHGVRRALAALLDASLLRSPVFLGLALSQTICMFGYHAPFLFAYSRAKATGMDEEKSAWLIPLLGIANTIGRLVSGAIVEIPGISALQLTSVSFAIGGVSSIVSCFHMGYLLQFIYMVIFGIMAAAFMAMKSIILVDYLGIERLTNAFGLLLMIQGLACLCGPPLAGVLADATHDFNSAFYFAGVMGILGGASGFLIIPLKAYEIKKGMRDR